MQSCVYNSHGSVLFTLLTVPFCKHFSPVPFVYTSHRFRFVNTSHGSTGSVLYRLLTGSVLYIHFSRFRFVYTSNRFRFVYISHRSVLYILISFVLNYSRSIAEYPTIL